MSQGHPHANLMALYAEDAKETKTPWVLWERTFKYWTGWYPLTGHPAWEIGCEYRHHKYFTPEASEEEDLLVVVTGHWEPESKPDPALVPYKSSGKGF